MPICAEALADRLRWITPPIVEEEELELSRSVEATSRNALESEGCPPCYPPEFEFPYRDTPRRYKPIIEYWQTCLATDEHVLCGQLLNWRQFRRSQTKSRSRFHTKPFADFIHQTRQRLQKYNIRVPFILKPDPTKQNRLQNWLEYEDYCLRQLERFESKAVQLRTELGSPKDNNERPVRVFAGKTYTETVIIKLQRAEREIQRHHVLLHWVAQERQTMIAGATGNDDDIHGTVASDDTWRTRLRGSRMRRKAPAVMGKVRVPKVRQVKHPAPSVRSILKSTECIDNDPGVVQRGNDSTSQFHAGTKPPPSSSLRARLQEPVTTSRPGKACDAGVVRRESCQSQGTQQRAQPPVLYKTRFGRISKNPSRWVPT
ncbi:hypothetical protein HIM_10143 [Hirsutella minnesotensis 3608]|uniref:Uncharacterized protein n=1 Tax=Hirsutella minnesotensis 3608 TaxID=1043627 RepID=A0A0F7ZG89_9HYPO|nr:hypothetical protein HIM_10143 [Hirsutella minnesotensis 3608]